MFPGFSGVLFVVAITSIVGVGVYRWSVRFAAFTFESRGVAGSFEPNIARYFRLAEFMIGLASGSIVLLVGSSVFRGNGGHLPWFFASPLILLGTSVPYALLFMISLQFWYERYLHGIEYKRWQYCLTNTLGFTSAGLFGVGYICLVIATTRG